MIWSIHHYELKSGYKIRRFATSNNRSVKPNEVGQDNNKFLKSLIHDMVANRYPVYSDRTMINGHGMFAMFFLNLNRKSAFFLSS